MADPTNSAPVAISIWQSPVAVSTIVSALSQLIAIAAGFGLKWDVTDEQLTAVIGAVFQLIAIGSTAFAFIKRYTSKVQPLAPTQAAAETKAATISALSKGI